MTFPLVAITASSASLASASVSAFASACLGAGLEPLKLVGQVHWAPGGGGCGSSFYLHCRSDLHVDVLRHRNVLVGSLGLCGALCHRINQYDGARPESPEGDVDLQERLAGGQHLIIQDN